MKLPRYATQGLYNPEYVIKFIERIIDWWDENDKVAKGEYQQIYIYLDKNRHKPGWHYSFDSKILWVPEKYDDENILAFVEINFHPHWDRRDLRDG